METLTTKLDGTTRHLIEESGAFISRTRDAGEVFVAETGKAGAVLVRAARTEARAWARYLRSPRSGLSPRREVARLRPVIERRVLAQVDAALTVVGERVRTRLGELEPPRAPSRPRRARAKTTTRRPRRAPSTVRAAA